MPFSTMTVMVSSPLSTLWPLQTGQVPLTILPLPPHLSQLNIPLAPESGACTLTAMIMGTDVRGLSLGDEAGTQLLGDETNARTTAHRALGDVIGVLGAGAAAAVAENLLLLSDGERAAVVKVLQR